MNYKTYKRNNYNIHLIQTDNFKTITVSFVFQKKGTAIDEVYQALLRKILSLRTEKYSSRESLAKAGAKIYNPITLFKTSSNPSYRTFRIITQFANEKYTSKGMNKKSIEFVMDYFWHPYVTNDGFDKELFKLCKKNYIQSLETAKNYPEEYALDRFWQVSDVYNYKLYTNDELITLARKIDEKSLYEYYKKMFTNSSQDIFIIGDVSEDFVNIIDNYIYGDFIKRKDVISKKHSLIECKKIVETTDNPQTKLFLGYKMLDITKFEENYVAYIFSMILGGGTEGLLHKCVRTEKSLCYYIYANYYNLFNLILISAGIDKKVEEDVITLAKKQVLKIQNGEFSFERVEEIVSLYKNILLESKDNPELILNNLISVVMQNNDDIDTRINVIDKITKEDIVKFSKKIDLDTIYLLEGNL